MLAVLYYRKERERGLSDGRMIHNPFLGADLNSQVSIEDNTNDIC